MPTSALDIGSAWANVGKQLFQGQGAFEQGKTKMAQALAQEAMMGARAKESEAQAGLHTAKSDQLRQRMQYQTPEFSNKIAAGLAGLSEAQLPEIEAYLSGSAPAPAYFTPDVQQRFNQGRGAHLANLGATGDTNAEQLIKGVEILAKRGDLDRTMANPAQAGNVGQAYAAVEGKPLFHQGANGTMQLFTGQEQLNDVGRSAAKENIAKAAQAYAAANNQNATAKLHESQIPEVQARTDLTRSKIGQSQTMVMPDGSQIVVGGPPAKPMPAAALKMQNEDLDAIGTAASIEKDIGAIRGLIEGGKLQLGPVANVVSNLRNMAGASDETSQNFSSFRSTLEKMRNDSLRLNKGVQTEGDAQRAWNELVANINDPAVVQKRLQEIQAINQRAIKLRQNSVNATRSNYGQSPMNFDGYTNVAPAVGGAKPKETPQYTRQGTLNGRRVGVLADGRTVYQDTGEEVK